MRAKAFLPFPQVLLSFAENILAEAVLVQTLPAPPPYPVYLLSTLDRDEIFHQIHMLNHRMKGNHNDSTLAFGTCRQILFAPFSIPSAPPFITLPQFTWLHRPSRPREKQNNKRISAIQSLYLRQLLTNLRPQRCRKAYAEVQQMCETRWLACSTRFESDGGGWGFKAEVKALEMGGSRLL